MMGGMTGGMHGMTNMATKSGGETASAVGGASPGAGMPTAAIMLGRPKMMTVVAIMAGLAPIFWSVGAGSEVMQCSAVPMIGGMISSTAVTLAVTPAIDAEAGPDDSPLFVATWYTFAIVGLGAVAARRFVRW